MGQVLDPATGRPKPQAIMPGQMNQQYILEGFTASFMIAACAIGMLAMERALSSPGAFSSGVFLAGLSALAIGFLVLLSFMRIKVGGYMVFS